MSRIIEELERAAIEVTYENIAIYAVFVSEEDLVERLQLNELWTLKDFKLSWLNNNFSQSATLYLLWVV